MNTPNKNSKMSVLKKIGIQLLAFIVVILIVCIVGIARLISKSRKTLTNFKPFRKREAVTVV